MLTALLLLATEPALAESPAPHIDAAPASDATAQGWAMRPLTYPANPDLTEGKIENFFSLYIDPDAAAATLKPKTPVRGNNTETLPIVNIAMAWQEVTVDGTKIGIIGPLTTGAIRRGVRREDDLLHRLHRDQPGLHHQRAARQPHPRQRRVLRGAGGWLPQARLRQ